MVLGYHLIMTTYGFWLPNDPRGSWSKYVGNEHLFEVAGRATKTTERRSLAGCPHDRAVRRDAKKSLQRPPVLLDGRQALAVSRGFAERLQADGMVVWPCAIMPDHVHLAVARSRHKIEYVARRLKAGATKHLTRERRHPFARYVEASGKLPTPWARGEWKVFLDSPDDILRAISYAEQNPIKAGLRPQNWPFVVPYQHFV